MGGRAEGADGGGNVIGTTSAGGGNTVTGGNVGSVTETGGFATIGTNVNTSIGCVIVCGVKVTTLSGQHT